MIAPGSPYTVTVFCLDVWPEVTSERHPVMVLKSSDTSLFARPSNGGALTLTFILRLHSSNPSGPERLDLGDTDTSTSTHPSRTLQTSETFMSPRISERAFHSVAYTHPTLAHTPQGHVRRASRSPYLWHR